MSEHYCFNMSVLSMAYTPCGKSVCVCGMRWRMREQPLAKHQLLLQNLPPTLCHSILASFFMDSWSQPSQVEPFKTHIKCSLPDTPVSKSAQTPRLNLMVTLKSCSETVAMETVQTCLAHVLGYGRIQRVPACAHVMHACTPHSPRRGRATPRRTSQSCHCTDDTGRNPGL